MNIVQNRPAGYGFLIERYGLSALPNWHSSFVSSAGSPRSGMLRSVTRGEQVESVYPLSYWPGDSPGDHLEFALKYDGVNLGILAAFFDAMPEDDLADLTTWIHSRPIGKYTRKIWFLYEFLTETKLPLADLDRGNYIELLEPDHYYTRIPGRRIPRQRILNNLLGGKDFCPLIRRTEKLSAMDKTDLRERSEKLVHSYPPELLRRALSYLYSKETKSSFEIEHIKPSAARTEKFVGLLEMAEHNDFCRKSLLVEAQNRIVDPRFQDRDYRTTQNYVGQSVSYQKQIVHYVCPKPGDLPGLMDGLFEAHNVMKEGAVPAVIHAAAVSYGFVFLHPFEDGNGRIHRFLIHNILFLRGAVPKGLMFPVSAAMLKNPALYDGSLEAFSNPLMELVEYDMDELGQMTVHGETVRFYRYIDMTPQAEALYDFVELTIEHELVEELEFLANYDKTRQAIREIIDMPDRLMDLFIRFCLQNNGRLSAGKRKMHFDFLSDDELAALERIVSLGYSRK